jgi:drug/metabolite transporter (DMT)-like permease
MGKRRIAMQQSIFARPTWVTIFALTAAIAWGWAYPLIKIGFEEFQIHPDMTGSKMLFAGVRFFLSGVIILTIARATKRNFQVKGKSNWGFILLFTLLNTTLHYAFFYIGLSHSDGARAAILNSLSVFVLVLLACAIFPSDKLTTRKILGCVLGFVGILLLNLNAVDTFDFTLLGDGMIVLNALCSAFASLMTRGVSKRIDIFVGTGYSLGLGGFFLILVGLIYGGTLPVITLWGCVILLLLTGISALGFALYNNLLNYNSIGKIAIYNSLIPIVGALTSCIFLDEPFYEKYIIAGALAAGGIYIINKGK